MNIDDPNVHYLATGEGHPSGQSEKLETIRRVLAEPETWAVPPQEVEENLLNAIRREPVRQGRSARVNWWPRIAAVAAAALLVTSLVMLWPSGTRVVLAGTDLAPGATGIATLDPTGAGWSIQVDLADLPPAEPGFYYEGWVWSDNGDGVSIGTFHLRGANKPVTLWAGVDVTEYPSIWISLQEEGAGNEVSDEIVMRGRIDPADGG